MTRRFPQPWTFEEKNNACFIVRDANKFPVVIDLTKLERLPNRGGKV
jgi:hypothetical protein